MEHFGHVLEMKFYFYKSILDTYLGLIEDILAVTTSPIAGTVGSSLGECTSTDTTKLFSSFPPFALGTNLKMPTREE